MIDGWLQQASGEWMWGILTELEGKPPLHHPRHNHLSFLLSWLMLFTAVGYRWEHWGVKVGKLGGLHQGKGGVLVNC